MRVTSQMMVQTSLRNLQQNMARLAELQEQATSQRAITRPSDDPSGTATAMRVRAEQQANAQYSRNIADGDGWLLTVDSALSQTTTLLGRVRDLVVSGANDGVLSPSAKEAIAVELESLQNELLATANTTYLGRSVFAGNSDAGVAFDEDFAHTGVAGSTVERRVSQTSTIRVDGDGVAVFGEGDGSVFALIGTIVDDLRNGTNIGSHLNALDERLTAVRAQHSAVGARHAELLRAEEGTLEKSISLEAQRAQVEDIDLGEIALKLKTQELAYQSALAVTARTLQPTLMDFLR